MNFKIRAYDDERLCWWACSSLNYDYDRSEWCFKMRNSDGSEDLMYDVKVYIAGRWIRLDV